MAQANEMDFQDDFRKVGHDATAGFEPAGAPANPTEHASSEHLDLRAVEDDLDEEDEDDDELEDDDEDDELEDEDELEDDDDDELGDADEDDDDFEDDDEDDDEDEEEEPESAELKDPMLLPQLP